MTGGIMIAAAAYLWKRWRQKEAVKTAVTLFALVALYPSWPADQWRKSGWDTSPPCCCPRRFRPACSSTTHTKCQLVSGMSLLRSQRRAGVPFITAARHFQGRAGVPFITAAPYFQGRAGVPFITAAPYFQGRAGVPFITAARYFQGRADVPFITAAPYFQGRAGVSFITAARHFQGRAGVSFTTAALLRVVF